MPFGFDDRSILPADAARATLVGRVWLPEPVSGPAVVAVRDGALFDLTPLAPTMSDLLEREDAVALARGAPADRIGELAEVIANSRWDRLDPSHPRLLAPVDLQAIKAAGVTFVRSLLERLVEERAGGDATRAAEVRARLEALIGGELARIRPGSPEAARLKAHLQAEGLWSQYLEVGIGPDAEIFTKAQPMSAVGHGAAVGIHPRSEWNNPEPELVLVADSRGRARAATLGNDVNLRDFEGRSALLLGRAKDNNASCAVGPFLRLFDDAFGFDAVRSLEIRLEVSGEDGFGLSATSSMREISRDPADLLAQTAGATHQYPDGFALFCGTMFAPSQDRDAPGQGFTHHPGDLVAISAPELGCLVNRVDFCDRIPPWRFGCRALMHNLAARGLLGDRDRR